MTSLTPDDIDLLITSLNHYKKKVRDYKDYPSEDFRSQQLVRIDATLGRLREEP